MLFLFENLHLLALIMIFQLFPPLLFSISDLKTMFETLLLWVFLSMLCEISLSIKLIFFDEIDNDDWKLYNLLLITCIISFYRLLLVSDIINRLLSIFIKYYLCSILLIALAPKIQNSMLTKRDINNTDKSCGTHVHTSCTVSPIQAAIRTFQISPLKINEQQISRVSFYMYLVWTSFNKMKKAYFQDQYRCLF